MTDKLRSFVFNFFYIFGSLFVSVVMAWALFLPQKHCARIVGTVYGGYILLISKYIMGITLEWRGMEHLPRNSQYIIAAKHQSAFETLVIPFTGKLDFPVIILKKVLVYLPLWGLYTIRMGQVPIDRAAGTQALAAISRGCQRAIDQGRNIIIFPQGTRVPPGTKAEYKSGIAKVYKDLKVPIVPMALNSGYYWGKNSFFKKPGKIVFEFLPPIPAGLPPLKMMEELEAATEKASEKLLDEAKKS